MRVGTVAVNLLSFWKGYSVKVFINEAQEPVGSSLLYYMDRWQTPACVRAYSSCIFTATAILLFELAELLSFRTVSLLYKPRAKA